MFGCVGRWVGGGSGGSKGERGGGSKGSGEERHTRNAQGSAPGNDVPQAMNQVMHHGALYVTHHVPPEAVRVGEALRVCALLLLNEHAQLLGHHLRRRVHLHGGLQGGLRGAQGLL